LERINEPAAFHLLTTVALKLSPHTLVAALKHTPVQALTAYALPEQPVHRRARFWKLAGCMWNNGFTFGLAPVVCANMWQAVLSDTALLKPAALLKRLHTQLGCIVRAAAGWADAHTHAYLRHVWDTYSETLDTNLEACSVYADAVGAVLGTQMHRALPDEWRTQLIYWYANKPGSLLLAIVHEEVSAMPDTFLVPLMTTGFIALVLEAVRLAPPRQAAGAVFCLANYCSREEVFNTMLRQEVLAVLIAAMARDATYIKPQVVYLFKILFQTFPEFMVERLRALGWFRAISEAGEVAAFTHNTRLATQFAVDGYSLE
jgi:hypothetical protein